MEKKKKIIVAVVAVIVIVILIAGAVALVLLPKAPPSGFKGTIKIGAILPLTGQISSIAQNMQNAMELAKEEINARGGINQYKLDIIYGDDKLEPTEGVAEIKRLIGEGAKIVVGAVSSTITSSCLKTATDNKVVLLSPASTYLGLTVDKSGVTPKRKCEYFFRDLPNDAIQGPKSAETTKNVLGCSKVAIIYEMNDYGIGLKDEFQNKFTAIGGQIVGSPVSFDVGVTDFKIQVQNALGNNPELIYIPGHYREIAMIVREAKSQGFAGKILASEAFECDEVFGVGGPAVDKTLFMKPTTDLGRSYHQNFVTNYTKKYGEPPAAFCDFAYDAVVIASESIKNAGNDGDKVREYMNTHTFTNTATRDIKFDSFGDVMNGDYSLYTTDYNGRKFVSYS